MFLAVGVAVTVIPADQGGGVPGIRVPRPSVSPSPSPERPRLARMFTAPEFRSRQQPGAAVVKQEQQEATDVGFDLLNMLATVATQVR